MNKKCLKAATPRLEARIEVENEEHWQIIASQINETSIQIQVTKEASVEVSLLLEGIRLELVSQLPALKDSILAFNSILLTFLYPVKQAQRSLEQVVRICQSASPKFAFAQAEPRCHNIKLCYDSEFALDIEVIAAQAGLSIESVIDQHCANTYTVCAMGFMPGFYYCADLPKALRVPRLGTPRTRVPAGSVGLAHRYSSIYPASAPGGWNIIGRTKAPLYTLKATKIIPRFQVGDLVRYHPISLREYLDEHL